MNCVKQVPISNLYRRISVVGDPNCSIIPELQRWVHEGNNLRKVHLQQFIKELRKFRRYNHALQISEWMEGCRGYTKGLSDHAIRLDLIAKVRGIANGEKYFDNLPKIAKVEPTYGALLNSYVREQMTEKAEAHMNKMEELGYATSSLHYNLLLTLYKNTGEFDKVSSVIEQMKKNNISQDVFTYNIRMNICAAMSNIDGVEKVLQEMDYNPMVKTGWSTFANLANVYIKAGLSDKAQLALKEMEKKMNRKDRESYNYLITLYAGIGDKDGINGVWQSLKLAFPKLTNMSFICMLDSLVKVEDIEGAEKVIQEWEYAGLAYDFRVPNILLNAYMKKGLAEKVELFVEDAIKKQRKPISKTWEILAEGYLQNKQLDKAAKAMYAALTMKQGEWKPKPANMEVLLNHFQEQGDVDRTKEYSKVLRAFRDVSVVSKETCHA